MRSLAVSLLVLASLLLLAPKAQAEDAERMDRMQLQLEMLLDLVSDLRQEVGVLKARVQRLEAKLATAQPSSTFVEPERGPAELVVVEPEPVETPPSDATPDLPYAPSDEAPPETEPEQPKDPKEANEKDASAGDPTGTYDLNTEASLKAVLDRMSEDERMYAQEMIEESFRSISMTLVVGKDGSFKATVSGVEPDMEEDGDGKHTARGTWSRDEEFEGEGVRLLLVTTHEDGEETDSEDESLTGLWKPDGSLRLENEDVILIFRRK